MTLYVFGRPDIGMEPQQDQLRPHRMRAAPSPAHRHRPSPPRAVHRRSAVVGVRQRPKMGERPPLRPSARTSSNVSYMPMAMPVSNDGAKLSLLRSCFGQLNMNAVLTNRFACFASQAASDTKCYIGAAGGGAASNASMRTSSMTPDQADERHGPERGSPAAAMAITALPAPAESPPNAAVQF